MNAINNHTIIIAEAGVNHNGDIYNAFKLIDAAVLAGVNYVKFQTFKSENLVSEDAKKAEYQIENTQNSSESQLQMLKKLELSANDHVEIIHYCNSKNIKFFSTAFDLQSLQYLSEIGLELVKIPLTEADAPVPITAVALAPVPKVAVAEALTPAPAP